VKTPISLFLLSAAFGRNQKKLDTDFHRFFIFQERSLTLTALLCKSQRAPLDWFDKLTTGTLGAGEAQKDRVSIKGRSCAFGRKNSG
jgi:hypothetical protein